MAMFHSLTDLDTNVAAAVYISEWCCVLLDVTRHMTKNNDQNLVRSEGTCSIM